jgi:sarcosine oxidase
VSQQFDVAVVGLGAMGSAALLDLARRGVRAVGFDRFHPPHTLGSTHGRSRIIRQAYYEDPAYVPLVQRAYERWDLLMKETGVPVFQQTGGLMLGPRDGLLVSGSRRSAMTHGLPFEELDSAAIARRFPDLRPEPDTAAILEPHAGILHPEEAVAAALARAKTLGAETHLGTTVEGWSAGSASVVLETTAGRFEAGAIILAAGSWLGDLIGGALPLSVERQITFWFDPPAGRSRVSPERLPVFIWEWAPDRLFYCLPDVGEGFKIARHHEGATTSPETVDRSVSPDEMADARSLLERFIPDAAGPFRSAAVCLYTNTPDFHFVLGPLPSEPRVTLVSACSGHGFKFASAIGEVAADFATVGSTTLDLSVFSPERFIRT